MPDIAYGQIWRIDGTDGWVAMTIIEKPLASVPGYWECLVIYTPPIPSGDTPVLSYHIGSGHWVREA
jgi:hypothetical protein